MISNIVKFFSGNIDKTINSVGNAIDRLVTSDEEKLILKNELVKIKEASIENARKDATEFEKEITKRWLSDNEHIITRLVRPVSFSFMLGLFGIIVLSDGNIGDFQVDKSYVPVIETLLVTMVIAYFGSRGIEKINSVKGK